MKLTSLLLMSSCFIASVHAQSSVDSLDHPFTLKYHVVARNVYTRAMIEDSIAASKKQYDKYVKAGTMSQESADKAIQYFLNQSKSNKPKEYDLTISYDGTSLIVLPIGVPKDLAESDQDLLFINKESVFAHNVNSVASLDYHLSMLYFCDFPLLGTSLPFLPTEQHGKVLQLDVAPSASSATEVNRLTYGEGVIEVDSAASPFVKSLFVGPKASPRIGYKYSAPTKVAGALVPGSIVRSSFYLTDNPKLKGSVGTITEFHLKSHSEAPMDKFAFDVNTYLKDQESVQVTQLDGKSFVVRVDKSKGNLADQMAQHRKVARIMSSRQSRSEGGATIAGIGTAIGFCAIGGLVIKSSKKKHSSVS